jgi:hypothetical protein
LPDFFLFFTLSFPLLTNDFGNVRIVEARVLSNDSLLVVLPIKNKSYQESAVEQDVRKQRALSFAHSKSYDPIERRRVQKQRTIGLTIPWAGYFRFWLTETGVA